MLVWKRTVNLTKLELQLMIIFILDQLATHFVYNMSETSEKNA